PRRSASPIKVRATTLLLFVLALEGRAKNVAERGAGVGRTVLGDRFLFLGDFKRLDGKGDAAGFLVELGDARIDLFADGETLGALVFAVAREVRTADEGRQIRIGDAHFEATIGDGGDFGGDDRTLAQSV